LTREFQSGGKFSIQTYLTDITPLVETLLLNKKLNDDDLKAHQEVIKKLLKQDINNTFIYYYIKANVNTSFAEELLTEYFKSDVQIHFYINDVAPLIENNFAKNKLAQLHYSFVLEKFKTDLGSAIFVTYINSHWGQPIAKSMLLEYCNSKSIQYYFENNIKQMLDKAAEERIIDGKDYRRIKISEIERKEYIVRKANIRNIIQALEDFEKLVPNHPLLNHLGNSLNYKYAKMNDITLCVAKVAEYYKNDNYKDKYERWVEVYIETGKQKVQLLSTKNVVMFFIALILCFFTYRVIDNYLLKNKTRGAPAPAPTLQTAKIISDINIRLSPSKESKVVIKGNRGSIVTILGSQNGWYKVRLNTYEGYVKEKYIRY